MERGQIKVEGDSIGWGRGERSDLLTEAATQPSVKMNKLDVKRLGRCVITVRGFLTYYGTLLVPTF